MNEAEFDYLCVGFCMEDPESGYCQECGRPLVPLAINDQEVCCETAERQPLPPTESVKVDPS